MRTVALTAATLLSGHYRALQQQQSPGSCTADVHADVKPCASSNGSRRHRQGAPLQQQVLFVCTLPPALY